MHPYYQIPLREVDLVAAGGVRDAVVKTAADLGDVETSRRLSLPGPDGYPGTDDWKYIAMMLKGQIVMQTRDIQQCVGDGPLVAHLGFILSRDGAGHESGHLRCIPKLDAGEWCGCTTSSW